MQVELTHLPYTQSLCRTNDGQHLGFCSRGGKIAVFAYQGGQALHAVQYNIYIVKFQGGKHPARGGECPRPPLNETLYSNLMELALGEKENLRALITENGLMTR